MRENTCANGSKFETFVKSKADREPMPKIEANSQRDRTQSRILRCKLKLAKVCQILTKCNPEANTSSLGSSPKMEANL
jgi:hypothetical protein